MAKIAASIILLVLSIILGIIAIQGFNNSEQLDSKINEVLKEVNDVSLKVLNICSTTQNLEALQDCKNESIPGIIENCKDKQQSSLSVCSDPRLNDFSLTIDSRIENILDEEPNTLTNSENLFDLANQNMIDFMDRCTSYTSDSLLIGCAEDAEQMVEICNTDSSVAACSDPRLRQIANFNDQIIEDVKLDHIELDTEETRLLTLFTSVSIPTPELLEICTHPHVLDRTFEQLRIKCDSAMDTMKRDYCRYNSQYVETICRDKRVDQFYGREDQSHNLPETSEIGNMNENISINFLIFKVTSVNLMKQIGNPYVVQITLELENTGSNMMNLSKEDFKIIDDKGKSWKIYDFFGDPRYSKESGEIDKLLPGEPINAFMFGNSGISKGNFLKLTLENTERFVTLDK